MAQLAENKNTYKESAINEAEDELEEEEQNAAELAAEQEFYAAQSAAVELYDQGQEYRHPSYFKYFFLLGPLALVVDGIDIFAHVSGVGIPFGSVVSFAATAFMLLVFFFTNTKQKRADEYAQNIEINIGEITQRIANAEKNIYKVARLSRHIPGARQAYRRIHLATIRRGRVALRRVMRSTKSPIVRYAAAGTLNLIPFLAILPWQLIGIYLSYRAEKESYRNANEASMSALESTGETATV